MKTMPMAKKAVNKLVNNCTRKEQKSKRMQAAGEKSWETRRRNQLRRTQVRIGNISAAQQKERILAVRSFLLSLLKNGYEEGCLVCGEQMKNTLDSHHIDGNRQNNSSLNLAKLCASCHRVLDKAKTPRDALRDLKIRNSAKRLLQ
jgi:hypothetical protein